VTAAVTGALAAGAVASYFFPQATKTKAVMAKGSTYLFMMKISEEHEVN
jgi:hypothetical protein